MILLVGEMYKKEGEYMKVSVPAAQFFYKFKTVLIIKSINPF